MRKIYLAFTFVALSTFLVSQTKTIPYQELPTAGGQPTGSGVFLGATMASTGFTVNFTGPSDRWIALGLGQSMFPTDVLIYSNGKFGAFHPLGWNDYYNSSGSSGGVNNDAVQNWIVTSTGTVAPAQRTVTATRVLNTGDANDVVLNFNASVLDVVWAFGATPDYTIAYHGNNNRANLIALPWLSPPTASFVSSTTVCAGSSLLFTNASTGGQTTYTWNFQGGNIATSNLTNPIVTYTLPGTYSVALTASNAIGSNTFTQLNYITVTPTVAPSVSVALISGSNPMCAGASVSFSATTTNGGPGPSFQWRINGGGIGFNNPVFVTNAITASANITCVLTSNAVCASPTTFTSAPITLTVNSTAPASLSVSIVAGGNPVCIGAPVTFTAVPGNGGSSPSFQWLVNNVNAGGNSPSFSSTTLNNGDVVSCILSSNASCASNTTGLSNVVTMTVSSVLVPSISISASSTTLCAGNTATITASSANGGNSPLYSWQVNGNTVLSSSVATIIFPNPPSGVTINCLLTSTLACANPSTGLSNSIVFTVFPVPSAPLITASGPLSMCSGESLTLTSSASMGNLWSNGSTAQSIVVTNSGTHAVSQSLNGCSSIASAVTSVTVFPLPTATFFPPNAPICSNSGPRQLFGLPLGGSYSGPGVFGDTFWPSSANIGINNVILYTYTDANNCQDTASARFIVNECTSINSVTPDSREVHIYPNPGPGQFTIWSKQLDIVAIKVIDQNGKMIRSLNTIQSKRIMIDLEDETTGIYTLEISLENEIIKSRISKTER